MAFHLRFSFIPQSDYTSAYKLQAENQRLSRHLLICFNIIFTFLTINVWYKRRPLVLDFTL